MDTVAQQSSSMGYFGTPMLLIGDTSVKIARFAQGSQSGSPLPNLMLFVWFISSCATMLWMVYTARAYYRLYEEAKRIKLPLVDKEDYQQYLDEPWRLPIDSVPATFDLLGILREPQQDPQLERARRRVWFRFKVFVTAGIGGCVLFVVLSVLLVG